MEYCPTSNILYVSEEMSKIGDIESILIQEERLLNGDIFSIKQILENLEDHAFPKSLDLDIKGKYYKVIITTEALSRMVMITFVDISDEFAKYLHIGTGYRQILEEKEKLRTILDSIPVAVWSRNKNMEIVYFNNTYSNIVFGYQKPFDEELLEIDKSAILSAQKSFLENTTKVSERPVIVESKRYIYQITDIPLVNQGMVVSVAWDVTNKEVVQKELQEVLSSHQNLLESSSNACMIIGADGKLKYYNDALVKFWGPDEGLLSHETTHEEILDHLYTRRKLPEQYNYAKFKKERTSLTHNLTAPREDLFYLPDGKCLRCVVIPHAGNALLFTYEDVTEKLSLERLNHTLSAVQKFTIDHLQEGICVFNETGELEVINAGMTKFWDLESVLEGQKVNLSDIIERILGECKTELELEELKDAFAKVMVSRIATQQTIKSFNGNIIHRSMTPLPNRGIMVSDLDVTDSVIVQNALIEKNEALLYVDKIKSEFLANMSYELRSPLTSIIFFTFLER
jgi:PAS domain-containing protein